MSDPLILCVGNPWCGDDAAGVQAGLRLRALGVKAYIVRRDVTALLDAWQDAGEVLLVDAILTGAPAGTVTVCELSNANCAMPPAADSTHELGVAESVAIARNLGRLPRRLVLYGIEARSVAPGSYLSPEVVRAVDGLVRAIASRTSRT